MSSTYSSPASAALRSRFKHFLLGTALISLTAPAYAVTPALPQSGQVVQGTAQIIQKSPTEIDIKQTSTLAVINWQSFNIGAGDKVVFIEPSALAQILNRIGGSASSVIMGQLQANGIVIITNPNGILFGAGSSVNVAAIIATTAGITDQNFMAGTLNFNIPSSSTTASVVNRGTITAQNAGLVGLVAPGVENSGVIQARLGSIQLVSGDVFTVDLYGDKLIQLALNDQVTQQVTTSDGETLAAAAANHGTLEADGGTVIMSAQVARNVVSNVINMDGIIKAQSVSSTNGQITLNGGSNGNVQIAGTVNASGTSANQKGGAITVTGNNVMIVNGAQLVAQGTAGGGSVNVGNAQTATANVATGATLDASATTNGNGGNVSVVATNTTVAGTLNAQGGPSGGNGGQITTTGSTLDVDGASVSTGAPSGTPGTWTLDPYDFTIGTATAATLDYALGFGNVTIKTTPNTNVTGMGDININAPIVWSANTTLTLDAYHSVLANANVTVNGNNAGLSLLYNDGGTGGDFLTGAGDSVTFAGTNPTLTINSQPYTLLRTASDLQGITTTGTNYALANDIDLSSIANFMPIGFVAAATTANNANPKPFEGTLDGLGHNIINLTINNPSANSLGLFGTIGVSGTVRNLGLSGGSITGGGSPNFLNFGMLAGSALGIITNVYSSGSVTVGAGSERIGGLVGDVLNASISDSYTTGSVSSGANSQEVGGLVGSGNGTISSSYTTGAVTAGDSSSYVGGLAGDAFTVNNSYATGNVRSGNNSYYVGGLTGSENVGSINSSYATGSVTSGNNSNSVGGLVGQAYPNVGIIDSYSTGAVNAGDSSETVGGLAGISYAAISQSYTSSSVTSGDNSKYVGGLVGEAYGANVSNSYAIGFVNSGNTSTYVGGLVGALYLTNTGGAINTSYATGFVTAGAGSQSVGGLLGANVNGGTVTSNYWDTATTGQSSGCGNSSNCGGGATALGGTNPSPYAQASYAGFDFTNTWFMVDGYTRPFLRSEYSTTITNAHQLQLVDLNLGANYTLANDIDMSELANPSGLWNTATGFVPIGFVASNQNLSPNSFTGTFNGFAHSILNLTINNSAESNLGLFAQIGNGAAVGDIAFLGGGVTCQEDCGMLAGLNFGFASYIYSNGSVSGNGDTGGLLGGNGTGATLYYVYVEGPVTGGAGASGIGGAVGANDGAISTAYAASTVQGGNSTTEIGGLVGYNNGSIDSSAALGSVSTGANSANIGGLVGVNAHLVLPGFNFLGTITNSYAIGAVNGGANSLYIGGLAGSNAGSISAGSYAVGPVSGTGTSDFVGGLVGANTGTINYTYAGGLVTGGSGSQNVGGLVGSNQGGTVTNSYWTISSTGQTNACGGDPTCDGGATGF